jgi:hypothetical protein
VDQANRQGRAYAGHHGSGRPRAAAGSGAARTDVSAGHPLKARLDALRHQASELTVHIGSLTHAFEQAADDAVIAHLDYLIRLKSQRLADLTDETAELERRLSEARVPAGERAEPAAAREAVSATGTGGRAPRDRFPPDFTSAAPAPHVLPETPDDQGDRVAGPAVRSAGERTAELISHGRRSHPPRLSRRRKVAMAAAVAAVIVTIVVTVLALGGASWPASVATVQAEADKACQNPNLESEPDQVNFACAKATRQVLWVFALLTSDDDPGFADVRTHRLGLEPIQPAKGGEVAWSLNLHHPYNPDNPIDSIDVAARAINNIIGGATLTGTDGSPVVQPGLESDPANCLRYTGSAAVRSHDGFPSVCAKPVMSPAGQAALVADVYKRWIVGAAPAAAQDAAVLFQNVNNPGDQRVQAILKQLQSPDLRA